MALPGTRLHAVLACGEQFDADVFATGASASAPVKAFQLQSYELKWDSKSLNIAKNDSEFDSAVDIQKDHVKRLQKEYVNYTKNTNADAALKLAKHLKWMYAAYALAQMQFVQGSLRRKQRDAANDEVGTRLRLIAKLNDDVDELYAEKKGKWSSNAKKLKKMTTAYDNKKMKRKQLFDM